MKKKLLALVMALAMCLLLLPGVALAAEQFETIAFNKSTTAESAHFSLSAGGRDSDGWCCGIDTIPGETPLTIKVKDGNNLIITKIEATLGYGRWKDAVVSPGTIGNTDAYKVDGNHSDNLTVSIHQINSTQVSVLRAFGSGCLLQLKDIKVYYEAPPVTITYKDEGGGSFTGTHEQGYPTSHIIGAATALKGASKTDYAFGGWFTTPNCTGAPVTSLGADYTSNITLYAKWNRVNHTYTYDEATQTVTVEVTHVLTQSDIISLSTAYPNYKHIVFKDGCPGFAYAAFGTSCRAETITLPSSITSIPNECFSECRSLKSIKIPESVTSIGTTAFNKCFSLHYVKFEGQPTTIADDAFGNLATIELSLPDTWEGEPRGKTGTFEWKGGKFTFDHIDANNDYICDGCGVEFLDKAKAAVTAAIDSAVGEDAAEAVTAFAGTAKGIVNNATTVNAVLANKEMALAAIAALKGTSATLANTQAALAETTNTLSATQDALEDKEEELDAAEKALEEKDKALNAAQADLVVKNYTLSQVGNDLTKTQAALTEKTAELTETQAALTEKNAALTETQAALNEKNAALTETQAALNEKNAALTETQAALTEKNAALTEAQAEIATLKQQIADLEAKLKDISGEMTMDDIMAAMGDKAYATEDGGGVVLTADGIKFPSGDVVKTTDGTLTYDAEEGVYVFTRTKNGSIKFTIEDGVVTKIESVGFRVSKNNGVFALAKEEEPVDELTIEDILAAMGDNAYTNGDKQVVATANGIKFPSNNIVSITEGELSYDAEEGVYVFARTANGTIKFTVEDGDVTKVESIGFKTAKNNGVFVK